MATLNRQPASITLPTDEKGKSMQGGAGGACFDLVALLTGLAVAVGALVALRYSQIPFFFYYPRVVDTVLLSDSLDLALFAASSLCVPASLALFVLRKKSKVSVGNSWPARLTALAVWAAALPLWFFSPPAAVLALFVSTVCTAFLNVVDDSAVRGLARRTVLSKMLVPAMTFFALIEFAPIYYWILASASPLTQVGRQAAELELNLAYAPFMIGPLILVAVLSSWAWVPVVLRVLKMKSRPGGAGEKPESKTDRRTLAAVVDLVLMLAIIVFYYPYFTHSDWIVGVDSLMHYYNPLVQVVGMKLSEALAMLSTSYHGAYVGILFVIQRISGLSPFQIVKFAPLVLAVLVALMSFSLIHAFERNDRLAVLCAACSILWIPTAWGIFSGLQANWAAVLLWTLFLFIMLASAANTNARPICLIFEAIISAGILIIHPWSWGVFIATLVIFAITLTVQKDPAARSSIMTLISALVLSVPAGVLSMLISSGVRGNVLNTVNAYLWAVMEPSRLAQVWNVFVYTFNGWGSFLNPSLLIVCLLGSAAVLRRKNLLGRYLFAWIVTCSVGSVLGSTVFFNPGAPGTPDPNLWRIIYVSPLAILLAFGVERVLQLTRRLEPSGITSSSTRIRDVSALVGSLAVSSIFPIVSNLPAVKLAGLVAGLTMTFLLTRGMPAHRAVKILVGIILVLMILNAAFRGLYPLILDPHNLLQ